MTCVNKSDSVPIRLMPWLDVADDGNAGDDFAKRRVRWSLCPVDPKQGGEFRANVGQDRGRNG